MAKFKKIEAGKDGWSDWEIPVMKGYRMACCDCGLVHDIDFKIAWTITDDSGEITVLHHRIVGAEQRVMIRARRNNRSTGQLRRHSPSTTNKKPFKGQ